MAEGMLWEYRVETIGSVFGTRDEQIQAVLNAWGQEGWEATQVFTPAQGSKVTLIARRPLSAVARRQANWPGQ